MRCTPSSAGYATTSTPCRRVVDAPYSNGPIGGTNTRVQASEEADVRAGLPRAVLRQRILLTDSTTAAPGVDVLAVALVR